MLPFQLILSNPMTWCVLWGRAVLANSHAKLFFKLKFSSAHWVNRAVERPCWNDRDSIKAVTYTYWKVFFFSECSATPLRNKRFVLPEDRCRTSLSRSEILYELNLCLKSAHGKERKNETKEEKKCAELVCVWQMQPGATKHERQRWGWNYRLWHHHQILPPLPWGGGPHIWQLLQ